MFKSLSFTNFALTITKTNKLMKRLKTAVIALLALGFILMIGGGSSDPDVFNDKMFDFRHITLSTLLILAGFVVEIVAIFWRGKK